MTHSKGELIEIEGMVHDQTDAAALISITGNWGDAEWIPKRLLGELEYVGSTWRIEIRESIAIEEGFV
jgi:hypothetical protein